MYTIGPLTLLYLFYEMSKVTAEERKKLIALVFILFSIIFWGIYEQSGGSLSIFAAKHLNDSLLGVMTLDPNGVNNSGGALFIIALAPLLAFLDLAGQT
jgi:POT family proton-dependent oligopeptide transporter